MNQGWIKIHRSFWDWEWADDPKMVSLFLYCISRANHTEKQWRGVDIKRGQFYTSYASLSTQTGLSVRNLRTCFDKLEKTGEASRSKHSRGLMVTVINYDKYQLTDTDSVTTTSHKRHANDTQTTTTKNDKNDKNEKNKTSDDVERVWNHYPNKQGKKSAIKGIIRAIENHGVEEIIRRVIAYAKLTDPKYYAHGSTYFNGDRYEDDLTPPKQTPQQMRGY